MYLAKTHGAELDVIASRSLEGQAVELVLHGLLTQKTPPPMFGLMHYAQSRMVLQPLSLLIDGKISYSTISDKAVDRKALLGALKFT